MICLMTIASLAKNLVNLVYPLHCAVCQKALDPEAEAPVCSYCLTLIRRTPEPHCVSCGKPADTTGCVCDDCLSDPPAFSFARSACIYDGAMKELIHQFKYRGKLSLAVTLSDIMACYLKDNDHLIKGVDRIIFVPIGSDRLRKRGFNQSKVIAQHMSEIFAIPLDDCLEKCSHTKSQNELSREDRLANLKGSFRIKKGASLQGLTMLMVDDVMTTGATLGECAKVLKSAGAAEIRCITLARGS